MSKTIKIILYLLYTIAYFGAIWYAVYFYNIQDGAVGFTPFILFWLYATYKIFTEFVYKPKYKIVDFLLVIGILVFHALILIGFVGIK